MGGKERKRWREQKRERKESEEEMGNEEVEESGQKFGGTAHEGGREKKETESSGKS